MPTSATIDPLASALATPRITLMGMPLDALTESAAVQRIISDHTQGKGGWVITPNLDQLRQFVKKPALRDFYTHASVILSDGMPLIWAARLIGTRLPERVPGSSLIWSLTAEAARHGKSIFLLGGNPGTAEAAAKTLLEKHPDLKVAGTLCPPVGFEKDPAQLDIIRHRLRDVRPDIVYVGLGFPKQEIVINQIRDTLPAAWFLGIGVSFSFVSGEIRRAPAWMQSAGLEWAHRLSQEPKRLFRRYVLDDIPFAFHLFAHATLRRIKGSNP